MQCHLKSSSVTKKYRPHLFRRSAVDQNAIARNQRRKPRDEMQYMSK